jgi:transcriptional regulator with XRE-family HTH domain
VFKIYYSSKEMKKPSEKTYNVPRLNLEAMGRRIRELRGFYMSQTDFAGRIGVTQSHLSALERGIKEPGASVLLAISQHSGKSVDWLLTGQAHTEMRSR